MSITDELKFHFKRGDILMKLIFINVGAFLALRIIDLILWLLGANSLTEYIIALLGVPASINSLGYKFWTIITYMFTHYDLMHILFNMLVLFWFGKIFTQYLQEKQLLGVYLMGGVAGALFYVLCFNIFPVFQTLLPGSIAIGASASIMAIMIAISVYVPDFSLQLLFFGVVRLKYIALVYVIIDIISITGGNAGGHIAHLGGALFGWLYITQLRKGRDLAKWVPRNFGSFSSMFRSKPKLKVTINKDYNPKSDWDYNKKKTDQVKEIDRILEKIKKSGYESLSSDEKQTLFGAKELM
jgi:membrane associated rhomboid family serine protease